MERLPREERYIDGVRRMVPHFPETAVREVIANALIHQDLMATGVGPVVEIYDHRIEVTNPGNSLISTDRILDERRSRNEKLAATMRSFGLCEERDGGLDKTLIEIEAQHLPLPTSSHLRLRCALSCLHRKALVKCRRPRNCEHAFFIAFFAGSPLTI